MKTEKSKMGKGKAIVLLSFVCIILAFILVMTFVRFPVGIKNYNSVIGAVDLDIDISGGTAYTLTLSDESAPVDDVDEVMDTLAYRLKELGYSNFNVKAIKNLTDNTDNYQIRIETKTTDTLQSDIEAATAYGEVKFYGGTSSNPTAEILNEDKAISDARYVGSYTNSGTDGTQTTYYQVEIDFTDYGYDTLSEAIASSTESTDDSTQSSTQYYLAIKLGDTTLMDGTAAITEDDINGGTVTVSTSSESGARQFALQIRTGGLAYKYDLSDAQTISATFGENSPLYLLIVTAALAFLLMVGLIVAYRGLGIISALSLLAFILIETLMLIAVPGISVSLASVIGIIFATVLAVDGFVMIGNRIKEEYANGKTVKASIATAYKRAFQPILNSNVVAGFIALMLFAFTSGAVKAFAITFGIGVVVSFISTILISRMFTELIVPLVKKKESFLNLKRTEDVD